MDTPGDQPREDTGRRRRPAQERPGQEQAGCTLSLDSSLRGGTQISLLSRSVCGARSWCQRPERWALWTGFGQLDFNGGKSQ